MGTASGTVVSTGIHVAISSPGTGSHAGRVAFWATLLACDAVLGLDIATWIAVETTVPDAVHKLVAEREQARKEKNWERADQLRDEILALGFNVEDTREGAKVTAA